MEEGEPHKVLNIGESTSVGFKLVSANSSGAVFQDLNGNLVKIGMNNEITTTFSRSSNNSSSPGLEAISLNEHNQYIANIVINNSQPAIPAIIDTGANFVTISGEIAASLGINYKNDAKKIQVTTASDNTSGYSVVLNTLQLGSINLPNIDAIVLEGHDPAITLIGMSFLKQLDLQYSGNKLEIKTHSDANNKTTSKAIPDAVPPPANSPPNATNAQPFANAPPNATNTQPFANAPPNATNTQPFANTPPNTTNAQPFENAPPNTTNAQPFANAPPNATNTQPFANTPPNTTNAQPFANAPPNENNTQPFANAPPNATNTQPFANTPPNTTNAQPNNITTAIDNNPT